MQWLASVEKQNNNFKMYIILHMKTISMIQEVNYDHAFLFAYSMREKTHAHRNYEDDV